MNNDIDKKVKEIYEKEFKSSFLGYNKEGIDEYLDDIANFLNKLKNYNKNEEDELDYLIKENIKLKTKIVKLEEEIKNKGKNVK